MLQISDGFTNISAGSDRITPRDRQGESSPTGARVTVDFRREDSLAPGQRVTVRYDFASDGNLREGTGIARLTRRVERWNHAVHYHYRLSYWIPPGALMDFVAARRDCEAASVRAPELADVEAANDPFHA